MRNVLILGASGFVGKHLALALIAAGHGVRCASRDPARLQPLEAVGCSIVRADMSDAESMQRALDGTDAVYISVHTLSPQPGAGRGRGYMDVEMDGLKNIVAACKERGVRRLIYITFVSVNPDSPSEWVRGRWQAEQMLLRSGLDVTVLRPAQIVGRGGFGFDTMVSKAKKPICINIFGNGQQRMQNIAVDDLVYYLVGVLDDERAFGCCFDVGCDDILTNNQMVDVAADVLKRRHPIKVDVPPWLLRISAPLMERAAKMPTGVIRAILDSGSVDSVGDPMPIRTLLPQPPQSYRKSVEHALS